MTLQLELGKKYLNRRGEVVEILYDCGVGVTYSFECNNGTTYTPNGNFYLDKSYSDFDLVSEYVEPSTKPAETSNKVHHLHADLIIAWAQGETVQFLDCGHWYDVSTPDWNPKTVYRINSEKNIEQTYALITTSGALETAEVEDCNVKFTFEDGKLIKAEVL